MTIESGELLEPRHRDIIVHDLMGAGYDEAAAEKLVAAALAAERKATVERLKDAFMREGEAQGRLDGWLLLDPMGVYAILDAEAAR